MKLFVPTTFNSAFIEKILEINNRSEADCIAEVYGSLPQSPLGSARPHINLPETSLEGLAQHVAILNKNGIKFNYLFNAPYPQKSKPTTDKNIVNHFDKIATILEASDNSVTVATEEMLNFFKKRYKLNISISLVLDIKEKSDIEYFINKGADRIVLSTTRNRDFRFLRRCGQKYSGIITLIANESCLFNCKNKLEHYLFSAQNSSESMGSNKDIEFQDPHMVSCTKVKLLNLDNLIKSSWIRPEDIFLYEQIGIEQIKLGDRTKPEEWLIQTYDAYLKRKSPDNFFDLIAITPDNLRNKKEGPFPHIFIDNNRLDNFIYYFFNNDICCLDLKCERCGYCKKIADDVIHFNAQEINNFLNGDYYDATEKK